MLGSATTHNSGNSIEKGPLDSCVSEESAESHRYSPSPTQHEPRA